MGGTNIFDWMNNNKLQPHVNPDKDRSLRGKARVKARKRERREAKVKVSD